MDKNIESINPGIQQVKTEMN